MAKKFNEEIVASGGLEIPALPSQAALATDSTGKIIAGTGGATGVPLATTGSYATWTIPSTDQVYAPLDIDNSSGEIVCDGELVMA